MVPKILHYIWIGNPKTDLAKKCIDSFHKFMSDYTIIEWNESSIDKLCLSEVEKQYYDQWYSNKKFAFCSDLIRLHILRQIGGVYVDCDVEFIKHLPDEFLESPFLSRINPKNTICAGCIWGCDKEDALVVKSIESFKAKLESLGRKYGRSWIFNTLFMNIFESANEHPESISNFMGYDIYPTEYFCPKSLFTKETLITDKTISIHHYALSWSDGNRDAAPIKR